MLDDCHQTKLDHLPDRTPVNGTFELTVRCNLHCKMCLFRHDDSENADIMNKELTAVQWINLAKQAADAGTFQLTITGGEPMIRPDFCDIWEGIYKQGFFITLYTNATLVTDKVMNVLQKYPPHKIGVTIYGSNPQTYEKVCDSSDAFDQMLRGIKRLKELPSTMEYRMTVIKDNLDDVDAVENLLKSEIDDDAVLETARMVFKPTRGACADVESCRLAPEENMRLILRRAAKNIKEKLGADFDKGVLEVIENNDIQQDSENVSEKYRYTLFGCNAGMESYVISWDGKMLFCQLMEKFARDINGSFQDAWQHLPEDIYLPPLPEKCMRCEVEKHCASCPAVRYLETNSFDGIPDYICKDAEESFRLLMNKKFEVGD